MTNKIRSYNDTDRLVAALAPADEAFRASEAKFGVARLERLVSPATLLSYRKGWTLYRAAIDEGDAAAVERLAPKMQTALRAMMSEAESLGHKPLSVETWEQALPDGRVLVVVKTLPEAHAVARAIGGKDIGTPGLESVVEHQRAGRALVVYSMEELARVIGMQEMLNDIKLAFPGAEIRGPVNIPGDKVESGVQLSSNQVADWATSDPLYDVVS